MTFAPLGDSAVVVTLGAAVDDSTLVHVRSLAAALERESGAGIVDVVPAYATVTVFYETTTTAAVSDGPYQRICRVIEACAAKVEHAWPDVVGQKLEGETDAAREIESPVCYEPEHAPDLVEVAAHSGLSEAEVGELHCAGLYSVQAVGFAPGFAYLGGLPETLFTPRRPTPRTHVPAGSVGIGWKHTGVYPFVMPGGWQLIGRTPIALFRIDEKAPALLRVGDHVRFRAITGKEFARWI
jgi:inhibitor of KinA